MNSAVLERSALFRGIPAGELHRILETTPHHISRYDKGETVFRLMERAERIGILLEGRAEAQKSFPNGSQVNVSVRGPGEIIGLAAAFAKNGQYPCDIVSLEPATVLLFRKEDLTILMQKDIRILSNVTAEIASATYMLQQRLELLSYRGIAQKAAFWLLTQTRHTGENGIRIPASVSKWAMLMNVSRPSLHRELRRMADAGIISYTPPVISIADTDALQEILSRQRGKGGDRF